MSAIHKAAIEGDVRRIERLLSQGADVAFQDEKDGCTPLMAACLSGKAEVDAVRLLLDHGSDVHVVGKGDWHFGEQLIALAVRTASIGKIGLLLERGARIDPPSPNGYTLLTLAACSDRMNVFELLLSAGAPVDGESSHRESALSVLSRTGRFRQVGTLLELGADPQPLMWSPLHRAIALGSLDEVSTLLDQGADIEETEWWERTPFLLAIQAGETEKAGLLLARGADRRARGRCGKTVLQYPLDQDDGEMMGWLLAEGFDIGAEDEHGHTALMDAVENSAVGCFRILIEAGAEWEKSDSYGDALIQSATHPQIIRELIGLGADPSELEGDEIRKMVGVEVSDDLPISKEDFAAGRAQRFGKENPERMKVAFWEAMVRNGWSGYQAASKFGISPYGEAAECGVRNAVWSHDRFGMSLTILPDGRFVQIAGEHEDHYDPDFCIYNDVFVHDGKGGLEIFGYPKEVFPPTDFHSATFVAPWIYLIGNLGYPETREAFGFETPVYRLHTGTWEMERFPVEGESPGWIHRHRAELVEGGIRISGGKIQVTDEEGGHDIVAHKETWFLDLKALVWRRSDLG